MSIYLIELESYDPALGAARNRLYQTNNFIETRFWTGWENRQQLKPILTAGQADPFGGQTATRCRNPDDFYELDPKSPVYAVMQPVNVIPGASYTFSVWYRSHPYDNPYGKILGIWNPVENQWVVNCTLSVTTSWQRYQVTFTAPQAVYCLHMVPFLSGDGYLYGAQFEDGRSMTEYESVADQPVRIHRFSSAPYTTWPTDTPASTLYLPNLIQPALVQLELPLQGGAVTKSYGQLEIAHDGAIDDIVRCSFDGRAYRLKLVEPGASLASATTVLRATLNTVEVRRTRLVFTLTDRIQQLDRQPLCKHVYLGTNIYGYGFEGDQSLKGRRKPWLFGLGRNVTPVLVNNSGVYQIHDGPIEAISTYVNGALIPSWPITVDNIIDQPPPENDDYGGWCFYDWRKSYLMPSTGPITVWTQVASSLNRTKPGESLTAIALDAGWPDTTDDRVSADETAIDAAIPNAWNALGLYVDGNDSALQVMTQIAIGIGLWFGTDTRGRLRMGWVAPPSGAPALTLTEADLLGLEQTVSSVPIKSVTVKYDRNYTVQTDLPEALPKKTKEWFGKEWRQIIVESPATTALHELAGTLEIEAPVPAKAFAQFIAARVMAIHGTQRDLFTATAVVDANMLSAIDLNAVVSLTSTRYGLQGKLLRIIGLQIDARLNRVTLTLWG